MYSTAWVYVLHSLTLKAVQIVNESEKLFISSEPLQVLFWANTMFNENDNKAKTSKKRNGIAKQGSVLVLIVYWRLADICTPLMITSD